MTALDLFAATHDRAPDGVWSAPGRVNLIGEHTDYNQGLVLPFAIDRRTTCVLGARSDRTVSAASTIEPTPATMNLDDPEPQPFVGWSAYVFGVVWALQESGVDLSAVSGVDLAFDSDVPVGAGLSSSAALECAVAVALNDHWGLNLTGGQLARVCQLAENQAVGAPTGIMDQSAALLAAADHALFLDCRDLTTQLVPLPLADHGLTIMVIDTHVKHAHATGGYADRRAACEAGAAALEVSSLREVVEADLERASEVLDPVTFRRVRHVVTENARVAQTVRVLGEDGPRAIGDLLTQSHASMRDDFEISVAALDVAVDSALEHGALGARMTGGGFGGAAIALVPADAAATLEAGVIDDFAASGFDRPTLFTVTPTDGARPESAPHDNEEQS